MVSVPHTAQQGNAASLGYWDDSNTPMWRTLKFPLPPIMAHLPLLSWALLTGFTLLSSFLAEL